MRSVMLIAKKKLLAVLHSDTGGSIYKVPVDTVKGGEQVAMTRGED